MLDLANLFFQMAVDGQHVQPAIEIVIEEKEAEFQQQATGRADPFGDRFISKHEPRALRNIKSCHFCSKISNGDAHGLVVSIVGRINSHSATSPAIAVEG